MYIYVYVCNYVCAFLNICVRVRSLEVKFKDCQLNKIRSNNWKLRIDELRANQESAWHVVLIVASECDVVRPPSGLRTKVKSNKVDNHNIIRTSKLIASNTKKKNNNNKMNRMNEIVNRETDLFLSDINERICISIY